MTLDEHTAERFQQEDGLTPGYESARAMMEDSQGDIWIGTETGLDRFRESNVVPMPIKTSTSRLPLVAGDHGDVWTYAWNFPQGSLVKMHGADGSEPADSSGSHGSLPRQQRSDLAGRIERSLEV